MTQLEAVRKTMSDGRWRTLSDIHRRLILSPLNIHASEAGISARLRDLRKSGLIVDRQLVKGHRGLYEYRVTEPKK